MHMMVKVTVEAMPRRNKFEQLQRRMMKICLEVSANDDQGRTTIGTIGNDCCFSSGSVLWNDKYMASLCCTPELQRKLMKMKAQAYSPFFEQGRCSRAEALTHGQNCRRVCVTKRATTHESDELASSTC